LREPRSVGSTNFAIFKFIIYILTNESNQKILKALDFFCQVSKLRYIYVHLATLDQDSEKLVRVSKTLSTHGRKIDINKLIFYAEQSKFLVRL
jgi:hypothetical protein